MKPIGSRTIHTARLTLRAPQEADAEALVEIGSLLMPLADAQKAVRDMVAEQKKPFCFHWVITRDEQVIGRVKGWEVSPYNGYVQLGYDTGRDFRNQGCMTEALQAVIHYLLVEAKVNHVYCSVRESNAASRRVCEKCGMTQEGTLRQHYARQDGGYDDVCLYGILRTEVLE